MTSVRDTPPTEAGPQVSPHESMRPSRRSASLGRPGFRPDVEGMRAVAITLVVAFHAGVGALAGGYIGVDVFFVLSGFLITGLLLDELYRSGTVSLTRFYARRARRLLPMSAVVLVATVVLAHRYVAPLDFPGLMGDVRAAALYVSNWHFAALSTNYMSDPNKSPVLHFWSLSVEEQFYIVWPLLLLGVAAMGSRERRFLTRRIVIGLAVLGLASLALSIATSVSAGPWAYFGLHTRAWELAAGAALAIARPQLPRLKATAGWLLGWLGLLAVVGSALVFGPDTVFPGWAALVPVGGTVLLVAAGAGSPARTSVARLLSAGPITYIGRISYAWYLWHWPLLVMAMDRFGVLSSTDAAAGDGAGAARTLPWLPAVGAVALSFVLAVVCHHAFEAPLRRAPRLVRSPTLSLALGAALTAAAVLAAGVGLAAPALSPRGSVQVAGGHAPAAATDSGQVKMVEAPDTARKDRPHGTDSCYVLHYKNPNLGAPCVFGDPHAAKTMVLLGDSQAEQWVPALDRYGQEHGWKVYLWGKAACPFNDVPLWLTAYKGDYKACRQWRATVYTAMQSLPRVDIAIMSRSRSYMGMVIQDDGQKTSADTVNPYWRAGTQRTLSHLSTIARQVVLLHATPVASSDIPACLSEHADDPQSCDFPRDAGTQDILLKPERQAAAASGAAFVDVTSAICPTDPCPVLTPAGRIIYRDVHHLTASFARSLADVLGTAIVRARPPLT